MDSAHDETQQRLVVEHQRRSVDDYDAIPGRSEVRASRQGEIDAECDCRWGIGGVEHRAGQPRFGVSCGRSRGCCGGDEQLSLDSRLEEPPGVHARTGDRQVDDREVGQIREDPMRGEDDIASCCVTW